MKKSVKVPLIVVGLLFLGGLFFVLYKYSSSTVYADLMHANSNFNSGEQARLSGNYTVARQQYVQALQLAQSNADKVTINMRLAAADRLLSDYSDAIDIYKAIAADPTNSSIARAYAVSNMTDIFSSTRDPAVTAQIFSTQPYQSLYVKGNDLLSYMQLSNYATTIYPIANAELHVGVWYASQAVILSKEKNPDTAQVNNYIAKAEATVNSADSDIQRIQTAGDNLQYDLPAIFLMRARIISDLERLGDTKFGTMDDAFRRAFSAYQQYGIPGSDGFARYYYAVALYKKYGKAKSTEITQDLAPLYTDPNYKNAEVVPFLKNGNNELTLRAYALQLGRIDPDFKTYLLSLGWTQANFSSAETKGSSSGGASI